jgi:hypothetical protein
MGTLNERQRTTAGGRTWSRLCRRPTRSPVGAPARPTTTLSWRRWCRRSRAPASMKASATFLRTCAWQLHHDQDHDQDVAPPDGPDRPGEVAATSAPVPWIGSTPKGPSESRGLVSYARWPLAPAAGGGGRCRGEDASSPPAYWLQGSPGRPWCGQGGMPGTPLAGHSPWSVGDAPSAAVRACPGAARRDQQPERDVHGDAHRLTRFRSRR